MQLQKLVYIANGFHLATTTKPLIYNDIKAWQFGPVIPSLYNALRKYGNGKVIEPLPSDDPVPSKSYADNIIQYVWDAYGHMTGSQLSTLTHLPGSPWDRTWEKEKKRFGIIDRDIIAEHYKLKLTNAVEA